MGESFNYEDLMRESREDVINYWDFERNLVTNIFNLIGQTAYLPERDIQLPILTCYALLPSALCLRLPVLIIQGPSGCGKSDLLKLLAAIHGTKPLGANSTPTAIRNTIATGRWRNPEEQAAEKNFLLALDNLNENTLKSEFLYSLLLNGYDRETDTIKIAQEGGRNLSFHVFGPKIITTVHNLYAYPKFSELKRRLMLIRLKEGERLDGFHEWLSTRLPIGLIDLKYLHNEYLQYWLNGDNCIRFLDIRKSLHKPKYFDSHKWAISRDLIAVGLAIGMWEERLEALMAFSTYWQWIAQFTSKEGALKELLRAYISELSVHWQEGITPCINPDELKKKVRLWIDQGKTEYLPRQSDLVSVMAELGWHLDRIHPSFGTKEDTYWVPIE